MHDLLRSLAQHVAGDECFVGDARAFENKIKSSSSSIKLRHLSIVDGNLETIPDLIMKQTSLRTLSFFHTPLIHNLPEDLFRKLRSLRGLNLSETTIANLPTSLGDLVHLRRLDLSHTKIREIPESIENLRNLLFLMLEDCKYLRNLPNGVMGLINLRILDVWGAPLDGLPVGIGRLKQLRSLRGFVANGCTLEELKSLSQLRYISMVKLERVSDRAKAKAAALQAKPHLVYLYLYCTLPSSSSDVQLPHANDYEEEDINRIREVFEELRPPPCIEVLLIDGYFGLEFPNWMMTPSSSSFRNLRRLDLTNCALCRQLPRLGMLPQLDCLWISGASEVTSIGPEFLLLADSCFSPCFPKLETLGFRNMTNWEKWWWRWEDEDNQTTSLLPSLNKLIIDMCPKLRSLPESLLCYATALKELRIRSAHSLREIQNLPSLTELILVHSSRLVSVSNFPVLKHLGVYACEGLKVVEGVDAVEHIQLDDREVESLPEWLTGAGEEQPRLPSLHKLTLKNKICHRELPDWPLIR
ncbi:putative disease resistance protein At3g14460 [Phoenix dactylifera]|uniref:Disease resistance protein At3g14460 n=1 Tax=Phoenix dactylifera TaxID=42345 RepID=A0A8B8ZSH8_PHODC|nr:putative disease resistance protein At3g14460 [Phoenix dactylifera]